MMERGLWGFFDGTEKRPDDESGIAAWKKKDQNAFATLLSRIGINLVSSVRMCIKLEASAHEAWKRLETIHVNKTLHGKILARNAFYTVKMRAGESMHEYATRVEELGESFMDLDVTSIVFGNNESLPVVGVGSTRLIVDSGPVDVMNVLHVPGVKVNLLSVPQLAKKGVIATIDGAKMNLFWKGEQFAQGVLNGDIYQLKTYPRAASSNVAQGSKATLKAWHNRLAHANYESVKELANKGLAKGVNMIAGDGEKGVTTASAHAAKCSASRSDECKPSPYSPVYYLLFTPTLIPPSRRQPPQLMPHGAGYHGAPSASLLCSPPHVPTRYPLCIICHTPHAKLPLPGDYRLSSSRTVLDIMERRIPFVPYGGLSFVDVRDVVCAAHHSITCINPSLFHPFPTLCVWLQASTFIAAMQFAAPNATYLLGAVNMTLYDYFHVIARCADVAPPFLFVPPGIAWLLAATASKLLPLIGRKDPLLDPVVVEMAQVYWYIDWSKAEKEFGFAPRPLAERYDMATAANSVNLDKARGLEEEEEELPSHLGGGADSSANLVKVDKARGGVEEKEEEGAHWAMGATTNVPAGNHAADQVADRVAEPVADSKSGGGYFRGWTKGLSNSFTNAGNSFTKGFQNSAEAVRDAAGYVVNNPGKTLTKSASDLTRSAGRIAHKAVIEHGHEVLANTAAGLVVGGVAGGLMAGSGTIARHAHAATMEEIGSFGAKAAGVAHLPVLGQP
ncbi:unnamed protein product [Closterium sp. NIES-64]|nr:unnamed protein product [Closterium sp. NIES-64]